MGREGLNDGMKTEGSDRIFSQQSNTFPITDHAPLYLVNRYINPYSIIKTNHRWGGFMRV